MRIGLHCVAAGMARCPVRFFNQHVCPPSVASLRLRSRQYQVLYSIQYTRHRIYAYIYIYIYVYTGIYCTVLLYFYFVRTLLCSMPSRIYCIIAIAHSIQIRAATMIEYVRTYIHHQLISVFLYAVNSSPDV